EWIPYTTYNLILIKENVKLLLEALQKSKLLLKASQRTKQPLLSSVFFFFFFFIGKEVPANMSSGCILSVMVSRELVSYLLTLTNSIILILFLSSLAKIRLRLCRVFDSEGLLEDDSLNIFLFSDFFLLRIFFIQILYMGQVGAGKVMEGMDKEGLGIGIVSCTEVFSTFRENKCFRDLNIFSVWEIINDLFIIGVN
ncbi:hypothetical protein Tco_0302877, partial [Tanacetum coccineum]